MATRTTKLCSCLLPRTHFLIQFPIARTVSSSHSFEQTIKAAVESKTYQQIPDLLTSFKLSGPDPNPFSFLSTFPQCKRTQVIDEILQSLIPLRPRSRPLVVYSCLLFYTLHQSSDLFPLSLAIIQRILRSGCLPVPQIHLLLSSAWLDHRRKGKSVAGILLEMMSIGYHPDGGTCNYVVSSLCGVDQLQEAVKVVKGMAGAGCVPDLESYGTVIGAMSAARRTADAMEMMMEMVVKMRLNPMPGTLVKVLAALRANREIWKGVELIEFLEKEGYAVGFESYELALEGCVECRDYILAAKVVMGMTDKGFIPYIKVRQKVVEGLAGAGEWKLACAVRQRFVELGS